MEKQPPEKQLLRILIADDSPDDVEMVSDVLRKAGFMLKTQRISDAAGLQAEVARAGWDLLLCEFNLAHTNPNQLLDVVRRGGADLPFIIFTWKIGDADVVKIMRAGAHDVVMKSRAVVLPAVAERELKARAAREQQQTLRAALDELKDQQEALVEGAREAICYSQDGMHINANGAYLRLFGYSNMDELQGIPFLNLIDKKDHPALKEYFRKAQNGAPTDAATFTAVAQDGRRFQVEIALSQLTLKGEACQQIVVNDVSQRKAAEQKLAYLSQHDPLTGLYNRHYFLQQLQAALQAAKEKNRKACLIYIDVAQLHAINAEFGLDVGDRLLLKLGNLFRERAGQGDTVARLGGDEFGVLLTGDKAAGEALAQKLRDGLKQSPLQEQGKTRECQCRIAVLELDGKSPSAAQLLSEAHRHGADRRTAAAPAPAATPGAAPTPSNVVPLKADDQAWRGRIEQALAGNDMHLLFQPIVNLHAEPAENYEVLCRIGGDNKGAGEFIAAAERAGLATAVDLWVINRLCKTMQELRAQGKEMRFFVNVSTMSLHDPQYLAGVRKALDGIQSNARALVFEIAETAVAQAPSVAAEFAHAVKKLGGQCAIDDFALGNMQFVRTAPVSYLKIASALVQDLANDNIAQLMVQAIAQIGKSLQKRLIAKSVENADMLTTLWNYEIDFVQGHYFQPPGSELGYDFNVESLSSDNAVTGWRPAP